jgi:hypothetical protein
VIIENYGYGKIKKIYIWEAKFMQNYDIKIGKKEIRNKFTATFVATILVLATLTAIVFVSTPTAMVNFF